MASVSGSNVCEWHRQSIPFLSRSHPISEPWNPSGPPCRLVTGPCVIPRTSPRFLRTWKNGRSLPEARDSFLAASFRPACDLQYPSRLNTNEEGDLVYQKADCIGLKTIDRR